jgi:hypothetical protein
MTTDNLALWNAVQRTPEEQTKQITGKAYKGTSPKPHWLVMRATEIFGPCGIGWGFDIVKDELLDGALLAPDFRERIHEARVRVWYIWQGQRGEVEHVGQTQFCGRRKDGTPFTDEDAPKKSVTDALVKALSMIGFAGDIFLGRYDDSKYINDLREEAREEARSKTTAAKSPPPKSAPVAPSAPRLIEVPLTADSSGPDWTAWGKSLVAQVNVAPDERTVTAWMAANESPLANCEEQAPKIFGLIREREKQRLGTLSQRPHGQAA